MPGSQGAQVGSNFGVGRRRVARRDTTKEGDDDGGYGAREDDGGYCGR